MADVINLRDGEHGAVFQMLPWYATGALDAADRVRVEAHLSGCAECQGELRFQRGLKSEIAGLPLDVGSGWRRMLDRIAEAEAQDEPRTPAHPPRAAKPWLALAAACCALAIGGVLLAPFARPALYRALGSGKAAPAGEVLVMFRPDTPERALRRILNANQARLVDGPTAAGAYVLRIAPQTRAAALANLRGRPEVLAAGAVDTESHP